MTDKKTRTPSETTLKVRAFAKVQRLRDEINRREAAENKHGMRFNKTMTEKRNALDDALKAFKALTGSEPEDA